MPSSISQIETSIDDLVPLEYDIAERYKRERRLDNNLFTSFIFLGVVHNVRSLT